MTTPAFESILARLYVDPVFRAEFLADPALVSARAGLSAEECRALMNIDREGLVIASVSFQSKREKQRRQMMRTFWYRITAKVISLIR